MIKQLKQDIGAIISIFDEVCFCIWFIDTAIETRDASKMDGPAFHKVSDLLKNLQESKLIFAMSTDNDITDRLISGQINSILLLKKNWSANQHLIVRKYKETNNQLEVAKELE